MPSRCRDLTLDSFDPTTVRYVKTDHLEQTFFYLIILLLYSVLNI